jgi:hypothetical protein
MCGPMGVCLIQNKPGVQTEWGGMVRGGVGVGWCVGGVAGGWAGSVEWVGVGWGAGGCDGVLWGI